MFRKGTLFLLLCFQQVVYIKGEPQSAQTYIRDSTRQVKPNTTLEEKYFHNLTEPAKENERVKNGTDLHDRKDEGVPEDAAKVEISLRDSMGHPKQSGIAKGSDTMRSSTGQTTAGRYVADEHNLYNHVEQTNQYEKNLFDPIKQTELDETVQDELDLRDSAGHIEQTEQNNDVKGESMEQVPLYRTVNDDTKPNKTIIAGGNVFDSNEQYKPNNSLRDNINALDSKEQAIPNIRNNLTALDSKESSIPNETVRDNISALDSKEQVKPNEAQGDNINALDSKEQVKPNEAIRNYINALDSKELNIPNKYLKDDINVRNLTEKTFSNKSIEVERALFEDMNKTSMNKMVRNELDVRDSMEQAEPNNTIKDGMNGRDSMVPENRNKSFLDEINFSKPMEQNKPDKEISGGMNLAASMSQTKSNGSVKNEVSKLDSTEYTKQNDTVKGNSIEQRARNKTVQEENNFLELSKQTGSTQTVKVEKYFSDLNGQAKPNETIEHRLLLHDSMNQTKLNKIADDELHLPDATNRTEPNKTVESEPTARVFLNQTSHNKAVQVEANLDASKNQNKTNETEKDERNLQDSMELTEHIKTDTEVNPTGLPDTIRQEHTNETLEDTNTRNSKQAIGLNETTNSIIDDSMEQSNLTKTAEKMFTLAFMGHTEPTIAVSSSLEFPHMPDPCHGPRRRTNLKDYLCMEPLEFLPMYKNPCWRGRNYRLRCLPYFHLFGMSKSGTTDLFQRLYFHPEIVPNKGLSGKEVVFWTRGIFKAGDKSLAYYTNSFFTKELEKATDENGYHYRIIGHGDPHDMWERFLDWSIPQNDPAAEEMMWTMPYVERHLNPGVKLLLMLRDPVERLYSVFYFAKQGNSSAQFDEYVKHDLALLNTCLRYHTLRHCVFDETMKLQFKTRIYSSFYAELLRDWLKAFPRDQILILRNEDYAKDISGTLTKIFTFLNVSLPDPTVIDFISKVPRAHVTKAKALAEPMSRETRTLLTRLYRRSNEELAEMIGDDRFNFRDVQKGRR